MAYDEDEDLEDSTTAAFWRKWDKEQADFEMPWEGWVEKYFPETVPLSVYAESNEPMFEDHQTELGQYRLSIRPEIQHAFLRACEDVDNSAYCYYEPDKLQEHHFWTRTLKREMEAARERRIKMARYY